MSEEEAEKAFARMRTVVSRLLRVPKAELEERLAEKRTKPRIVKAKA